MKKSYLRCVWCVFRALVAPTLIIYSLTACAPGGVGSLLGDVLTGNTGGGDDVGDVSSGESPTGVNATDVDSESSGSDEAGSEESGDADAMPTAQLPLPSLKNDDTFAFAQDANNNVPITGSVENYGSDSMVAVSTSDITATAMLLNSPRPLWERVRERGFLIADAHASSDNVLCSTEGVTCCPLNEDGTFECYYETTNSSVTSVYLAVIDSEGNIASDSAQEDVHGNVLYLANAPQDMVSVGDDVYALTNGMAVKISPDSDDESGATLAVTGDNSSDYESFVTQGERLAYDETNEILAVMDSESGVALMQDASGGMATVDNLTIAGAMSYTKIKATNELGYFGIENEVSSELYTNAYLYATVVDEDATEVTFGAPDGSNIKFIEDGDVDESGNALTHKKTLAFDSKEIGGVDWTIVSYLDGDQQTRVRWIKQEGDSTDEQRRFGGQSGLGTYTQIPELSFYHGSGSEARFAVLDTDNDRVMLGSIPDLTQDTLSFDTTGVSVGDEPVAMTLKGGRLFVLNKGGQTVSIIRLFNADGSTPRSTPRVSATLRVSDYLQGSTFTFSPRTLMVDDDHVYIGDATTKALIVVNRDEISEESIDDETSVSTESETTTETETSTSTSSETGTVTASSSETSTATTTSSASSTASSSSTGSSTGTASSSGSSSSTSTTTSTATDPSTRGRGR